MSYLVKRLRRIEALEAALREIEEITRLHSDPLASMRVIVKGTNNIARAALAPEQDK